jgi:hypothetical protein
MPNKIAADSTCSVYDLENKEGQIEECIKLKSFFKPVKRKISF